MMRRSIGSITESVLASETHVFFQPLVLFLFHFFFSDVPLHHILFEHWRSSRAIVVPVQHRDLLLLPLQLLDVYLLNQLFIFQFPLEYIDISLKILYYPLELVSSSPNVPRCSPLLRYSDLNLFHPSF